MSKYKEIKSRLKSKSYSELLVFGGLLSLTLLSGAVLASSYVSADESVVDAASVTVPVSCTMSGSGMNSHNAEIANGIYRSDIGSTTMSVLCNDNGGFSIYATGYTGEEIGATNSNKLVGTSASGNAVIDTGTATSAGNPDVSNWAMKLSTVTDPAPTYPIDITNNYNIYHAVPNEWTKVATRSAGTDVGTGTTGSSLTTTYAAYISTTQPADTYSGKVKYTLVHPSIAPAPEPCPDNKPCIRVTTPPIKTVYRSGEIINLEGAVVKVYNPDGSLWKDDGYSDGVIPNNELLISPSVATNNGIYTNSGGVNVVLAVATGDPIYDRGNIMGYRCPLAPNFVLPYGESIYLTHYGGRLYAASNYTGSLGVTLEPSGGSMAGRWGNVTQSNVIGYNYTYYGEVGIPESTVDPTNIEISSLSLDEQPITITWNRLMDGEELSTELNISVEDNE